MGDRRPRRRSAARLADTELAGVEIPAGAVLVVSFASANRDGTVFPDAAGSTPTAKGSASTSRSGSGCTPASAIRWPDGSRHQRPRCSCQPRRIADRPGVRRRCGTTPASWCGASCRCRCCCGAVRKRGSAVAARSPAHPVTNDDGLLLPGLRAAAEAVADLGELLLVAPATRQTAMSRAFIRDADAGASAGRPPPCRHDRHCVGGLQLARHGGVARSTRTRAAPISLCVSGINYGENLGSAIGVSGTIGAALEGRCLWHSGHARRRSPPRPASGTPSVSSTGAPHDISPCCSRRRSSTRGMPTGVSVLNLNVPRGATSRTELRKTVQSHQPYAA